MNPSFAQIIYSCLGSPNGSWDRKCADSLSPSYGAKFFLTFQHDCSIECVLMTQLPLLVLRQCVLRQTTDAGEKENLHKPFTGWLNLTVKCFMKFLVQLLIITKLLEFICNRYFFHRHHLLSKNDIFFLKYRNDISLVLASGHPKYKQKKWFKWKFFDKDVNNSAILLYVNK